MVLHFHENPQNTQNLGEHQNLHFVERILHFLKTRQCKSATHSLLPLQHPLVLYVHLLSLVLLFPNLHSDPWKLLRSIGEHYEETYPKCLGLFLERLSQAKQCDPRQLHAKWRIKKVCMGLHRYRSGGILELTAYHDLEAAVITLHCSLKRLIVFWTKLMWILEYLE